jgi:predicted DNA-binding transcriptional regulator YafY
MEPEGRLNLILNSSSSAAGPADTVQAVEMVDELVESAAPRRAMNSTAYRIFKLLQWLIDAPLSVEALNRKFCDDPQIGKPLSSDSIWLYINTLKALGCRIRRPSPRNGFQYEMLSHPFGLMLNEGQLETLAQAKAFAQQKLDHQEMRILDGLFKKMVEYSDCPDPGRAVEHLFSQSRSFDYQNRESYIFALETAIAEEQILSLRYLSPMKGKEKLVFLPMAIFYEQGVVYIRGERPENDSSSSLRLDRILGIEVIKDTELLVALKARRQHTTAVTLHILAKAGERFDGLKLGENQGIYEERICYEERGGYYEVTLQARDFFYLKQRLLACGLPFRIVTPLPFKEDVTQTLQSMLAFYQGEEEGGNGND